MITKKQLQIFQVFARNPFAEYTLKQIKELSKEKSNNSLSLSMKQFRKENLLKEQRVGRSSLYTLNLDNAVVYNYLALANHLQLGKLVQKMIDLIKKGVEKYTKFYSIVIFGSYAVQRQSKSSDLDIAIFVETGILRKEIQRAVDSVKLKSALKLDTHIITSDEFLDMLKADKENLGKQIVRKHLAIYNNQIFYAIVKEGMRNGFRV